MIFFGHIDGITKKCTALVKFQVKSGAFIFREKFHCELRKSVPWQNLPRTNTFKVTMELFFFEESLYITVNDIVWELNERVIISDKDLWLKKLKADPNAYWLARKCVNYIQKNK